jgi:hypothetical protein
MEIMSLLQSLRFSLPQHERAGQERKLEQYINYLINEDFNRLVQLLYTVDVDEQKLKSILLLQPEQNAAQIITRLIVLRQQEKEQSRRRWGSIPMEDDEERW